jgi:ribonuclease H / adenosylcobalamin/alpha-ribazole phosphatase
MMNNGDNIRKQTINTIVSRLATLESVCSITFVGSFLQSDDISVVSDIDVVVIVDKLTENIFRIIKQKVTTINGSDCGLTDYQVKVNMSFGPLKFNDPKTMVFHLMVYDIAAHRKHVMDSPFTCYDWELNPAVYGENLSSIYSAAPLQLNDLIGTRRGLCSYLDDLKNGTITFRHYVFNEGLASEIKESFPMDDRHRKEYGYHVIKYLMLNLLKILYQKNLKLNDTDLAFAFVNVEPSFETHVSFFLELSAWKRLGATEPNNIQNRLEQFIINLDEWLGRVQKSLPRIVFVRHVKTLMNDGTFLGVHRDPEIEINTVKEIKSGKFDAVYTGTLKRTITTGALLKTNTQKQNKLLNEIDYGLAEGLNVQQLSAQFPDMIRAWQLGEDPKFPEGECQEDVANRLRKFIEKELYSLKNENVAVVTHNVVIRTLLGRFFQTPIHKWVRFLPEHLEMLPCLLFRETLIPQLSVEQRVKFRDQITKREQL